MEYYLMLLSALFNTELWLHIGNLPKSLVYNFFFLIFFLSRNQIRWNRLLLDQRVELSPASSSNHLTWSRPNYSCQLPSQRLKHRDVAWCRKQFSAVEKPPNTLTGIYFVVLLTFFFWTRRRRSCCRRNHGRSY